MPEEEKEAAHFREEVISFVHRKELRDCEFGFEEPLSKENVAIRCLRGHKFHPKAYFINCRNARNKEMCEQWMRRSIGKKLEE